MRKSTPAPKPASPLPPSPGTPVFDPEAQTRRGEGRGEGSPRTRESANPHPNPLPAYREREKEGSPRWTDAQLRGITTVGHSLLVSAAAGSGKTAMLAARCAHLVCDAADPCEVDELLVVTFTEAAAAQMKSRIHSALRDRASAADSDRIRRQVSLVDRASVSTLHSFCARLLREHFHAVGLDPAFTVLDGDEASLLRREVARALFDDRYELDSGGDFHRFIDAYGEGDDTRLIERVVQTHEMIASLVDPEAWLRRSNDRIAEAARNPLETTELGRELIDALARSIDQTRKRCDRALELVSRLDGFPKYVAALKEHAQTLRHWEQTLASDGVDALAEEVSSLDLPRLPPVSSTTPGKELAKGAIDSVRDAMTKSGWRDLLRFTGAQWQAGLDAVRPHTEVFLSLVRDFEARYTAAKEASRVVDFSDLERLSLRVLSEDPSALRPSPAARAYHRRFKHVLVDEYQDINEVQDAILCLLSRECVCDDDGHAGNLFCVGDVKQSIYRFRLAEAARFLERQKLFRTGGVPRRGEVIDLQANFRSRAPLLDAINSVFERLMTEAAVDIEYDHTHRLEAGMNYPTGGGATCFNGSPIEMHLLPAEPRGGDDNHDAESQENEELDRSEREAALIAKRIGQLVGLDGSAPACVCEKGPAGEMISRPIRFGDIVILLRATRFKSTDYANVLRRAGIPVHAQSGTGYFDSTEIRDMMALLGVLDNQRQDIPLATVLRSPLANLPGADDCLARVRLAYPLSDEKPVPFHDAVVTYAAEKQDELAARLRDFLGQLGQWRKLAHSRPLADALRLIFEQSGYVAFCAGLQDGEQRVANLMELQERAASFGTFNRQGLSRFMRMLESLRDGSDLGQPAVASEADDVVRVMSVHRSKGLEFPVVILPDLGKRINVSDCSGSIITDRSAGLGLAVIDEHRMIRYPSLASVMVAQRLRQQALAEELRVLYVAMTRAKEHLILIGTCKADAPDAWASRWANHAGAFPRDLILDASTLLHWIGPTAVAAGEDVIRIQRHTAEEVATWDADHTKRQALSPQQERLAALESLDPAPGLDPVAREVVGRLEFPYAFAPFTKLAAAEAVTARGKRAAGTMKGDAPAARSLPRPKFLAEHAASPSDIGTATHLVLMHLDFARPCDDGDLAAQIGEMVDRKLVTAAQADAVDRQALLWLIGTEVGKLLRANAARLRREAPIHFAAASELALSNDPLDRVMIRGRIDVLVPGERGCTLIDYKTDAIDQERVSFRASDYAPQLNSYRRAVEQITGRPVQKCYVVFLTPRMIVAV